jgi:hypothetical protein
MKIRLRDIYFSKIGLDNRSYCKDKGSVYGIKEYSEAKLYIAPNNYESTGETYSVFNRHYNFNFSNRKFCIQDIITVLTKLREKSCRSNYSIKYINSINIIPLSKIKIKVRKRY